MYEEPTPQMSAMVRMLQILVASLILGCVVFLTVAMVMAAGRGPEEAVADEAATPVLSLVGLFVAVMTLGARLVLRSTLIAQGVKAVAEGKDPPGVRAGAGSSPELPPEGIERDAFRLARVYFNITLLSAVLVEGAVFVNLVFHLVEGQMLSLAVAIVLILGMGLHWPTAYGLMRWIEIRLRDVAAQRGLAR